MLLVGAECHASLYPWTEAEWAVMFGDSDGPVSPEAYAWGTAQRDRAVIFGDGAGAFVLEANESGDGRGFLGFDMKTDGAHWDKLYVPGRRIGELPLLHAGDVRGQPGRSRSSRGGRSSGSRRPPCPRSCGRSSTKHGHSLEDLDLLLMHQANLRINEAVQKLLGLPDEKVFNNIQKYGNTTAATLPLVFDEAKRPGGMPPGSLVCFTALGAGLHWGAGLVRI